jgi:hypothetical protein
MWLMKETSVFRLGLPLALVLLDNRFLSLSFFFFFPFDVQVLEKALEVWNLKIIPITNPEVRAVRQNPLYVIETLFISFF